MITVKINLLETLNNQNEGGIGFDWVKRVESIDMEGSNGFALEGKFINDFNVEAAQVPGIYVTGRKGRGWHRTFVLRLHEDGTLEQLAFTGELRYFHHIKETVNNALIALQSAAEAETVLIEGNEADEFFAMFDQPRTEEEEVAALLNNFEEKAKWETTREFYGNINQSTLDRIFEVIFLFPGTRHGRAEIFQILESNADRVNNVLHILGYSNHQILEARIKARQNYVLCA